jgi:uncharacterized DUF497 family protein
MQAEDFEWDETKASENYAKHGVSFDAARAVFKDAFAVEELDDREDYGEDRFTIVGMSGHTLLFVAYALRGTRIRLISARRATRHEQDDYYQQNS